MESDNLVIALNNGLAPYAVPLVCDDLTGPRSLLGESSAVPRPVCRITCACRRNCEGKQDNEDLPIGDLNGFVLWKGHPGQKDGLLAVAATTYIVGACPSSFDVAWELMRRNALPEWGAVLASLQKQGRGQLRRHWHSPRGNLHVTFRLPRSTSLSGDGAAVVTGYLLARALTSLGFSLTLKWPNDLLASDGRKVGGILLEEREGVLLAGLGLNLVEAPAETALRETAATPAAILFPSCEMPGDDPLTPFSLWQSLVERCIMEYTRRIAGREQEDIFTEADSLLAWKGRQVVVTENDAPVHSGECLGFGPRGGLMLRARGVDSEVFSGSLRLA